MASNTEIDLKRIGSFAFLDLETTNLPQYNFNKVSITELSLYGLSALELVKYSADRKGTISQYYNVPNNPRVLHKLKLLFNPKMRIDDGAEKITGLDNYMLELETHFNDNAGNTILGFMKHLQQPVCLVAHNGDAFDFPIIKASLNKLGIDLPIETLCVDSLSAFKQIDKDRNVFDKKYISPISGTINASEITKPDEGLIENCKYDWEKINNTTPKRQKIDSDTKYLNCNASNKNEALNTRETTPKKEPVVRYRATTTRRTLFLNNIEKNNSNSISPLSTPVAHVQSYKLEEIFKRTFGKPPMQSHFAESDVDSLMKVVQCYSAEFMTYAEKHAKLFTEVESIC